MHLHSHRPWVYGSLPILPVLSIALALACRHRLVVGLNRKLSSRPSVPTRMHPMGRCTKRHSSTCDKLFWFRSPGFLMWLFQLSYIENSMSITLICYGLVSGLMDFS